MKITLQNGNVVEGTFDELNSAGLLPARTLAAHAVSPQLDLFQASLTAQPTEKAAVVVVEPKRGRPTSDLSIKIHEALARLEATSQPQQVSIASKKEASARACVYQINAKTGKSYSVNKVRIGDRLAIRISK